MRKPVNSITWTIGILNRLHLEDRNQSSPRCFSCSNGNQAAKGSLLSCEEEQFMREKMEHVKHAAEQKMWKVQAVLADRSGENFIDSAIFS